MVPARVLRSLDAITTRDTARSRLFGGRELCIAVLLKHSKQIMNY